MTASTSQSGGGGGVCISLILLQLTFNPLRLNVHLHIQTSFTCVAYIPGVSQCGARYLGTRSYNTVRPCTLHIENFMYLACKCNVFYLQNYRLLNIEHACYQASLFFCYKKRHLLSGFTFFLLQEVSHCHPIRLKKFHFSSLNLYTPN